jgi:DNA-binding GntR family transcriptional regulator
LWALLAAHEGEHLTVENIAVICGHGRVRVEGALKELRQAGLLSVSARRECGRAAPSVWMLHGEVGARLHG